MSATGFASHHQIPRCLLSLFDLAAAGCIPWSDFDVEAERWGVEPMGLSREVLAAMVEGSTRSMSTADHRRLHRDAGDFVRWGRRGGLRTLARYGAPYFSLLARFRWGRVEVEALVSYREGVRAGGDERGFTLPEMLVVIVILGILLAIGVIVLLGILEARRVDAATNQLKADLRLAHVSATNRLIDSRVVLVPENGDEDEGPDYHLVRLAAPYPSAVPVVTETRPRTFPGNVKVRNVRGALDSGPWIVSPSKAGRTRTVEFNSDGSARFYGGVSGSTCVTADGEPKNRLVVLAATSRVRVQPGEC